MNEQTAMDICARYFDKWKLYLKIKSISNVGNMWAELNEVHYFIHKWRQSLSCGGSCRKDLLYNVYRWYEARINQPKQAEEKPIEKYTYDELLKMARDKNIIVRHNMGKGKLIELIKTNLYGN